MRLFRSSLLSVVLAAAVAAPAFSIPAASVAHAQGRLVEREVVRYSVRPGDTMASIARQAGISLGELRRLNPDVDPRSIRVGQTIYLPAGALVSTVSIELDSYRGRIDDEVVIRGSGFVPGERVRVMVGDGPYRLRPYESVRANRRGRVEVIVDLPEWARPGSLVHFALQSRDGRSRAVARPFEIVARRPGGNRVEVTGTLTRQGVECPVMRGDDGRTYALLGDLRDFRPGDRITIEGRIAEMSICQQGTPVELRRIYSAD